MKFYFFRNSKFFEIHNFLKNPIFSNFENSARYFEKKFEKKLIKRWKIEGKKLREKLREKLRGKFKGKIKGKKLRKCLKIGKIFEFKMFTANPH